tara:strand:+ start:19 stop:399 length:381 start_codon:yes stop_codon:yes gene_type:complete
MNILLLGLVLYSYFVSSAPKVFKENKQLVLGMFIGVTIYQMNLVEGLFDNACMNAVDCMKGKSASWSSNKTTDQDGSCCNDKIKCDKHVFGNECSYDDAIKCQDGWTARSGSGGDKVGLVEACVKS